jgi:prephenate dehydrogenase
MLPLSLIPEGKGKRFLSPPALIIPGMRFEQVTIVGVGLIGGSVGLAAKARGVAGRVVGVGRDAKNLARAVERGAIDSFTTDLADGVTAADLVVVCTPVDRIADVILKAAPHCRTGTIFTDAGSTKVSIVAAVDGSLPMGVVYIPAHPIAGSEKTGVEHARADLFEDRVTVVASEALSGIVAKVIGFWESLGSRIAMMSPAEHDRILALTSHLPHAVAAAVAGATSPDLLDLTAGGFRDVTRIAAGDPELWSAIFRANRDPVLSALRVFAERLNEFRQLLEAGDGPGLVRWLTEGKQVRDALGS